VIQTFQMKGSVEAARITAPIVESSFIQVTPSLSR
jgi:hypothetical protein